MTGRPRAPFGTVVTAGNASMEYRSSDWSTVRTSWCATMYQTRPNSNVAVEMSTASYVAPSARSIDAELEWVIGRYDDALNRLSRD